MMRLIDADKFKRNMITIFEEKILPNPILPTQLMRDVFSLVFRKLDEAETVQQWISVKDRLPELIPCSAGTAYSEAVNVLTSGRKVLTAIWDGTDFIADADFWDAEGEEITHWTPVILPLPQPPKGEPNDKC